MLTTPPQSPIVLSYLALRKAVGFIAFALPFALAIPWILLQHHGIEPSISEYYYTDLRDVFVGALCAISMFMLCAHGYDLRDEIAGSFAAFCALGVAFFPCSPASPTDWPVRHTGALHYTFAAALFATLAFFCLYLFRLTADNKTPTPQKLQRNRVYVACGSIILACMFFILLFKQGALHPPAGSTLTFWLESASLWAFGIAWLVKGETFLKDNQPTPAATVTTDGHIMVERQPGDR